MSDLCSATQPASENQAVADAMKCLSNCQAELTSSIIALGHALRVRDDLIAVLLSEARDRFNLIENNFTLTQERGREHEIRIKDLEKSLAETKKSLQGVGFITKPLGDCTAVERDGEALIEPLVDGSGTVVDRDGTHVQPLIEQDHFSNNTGEHNEADANSHFNAMSHISDGRCSQNGDEATASASEEVPEARKLRKRKIGHGPELDAFGSLRLNPFNEKQSSMIFRYGMPQSIKSVSGSHQTSTPRPSKVVASHEVFTLSGSNVEENEAPKGTSCGGSFEPLFSNAQSTVTPHSAQPNTFSQSDSLQNAILPSYLKQNDLSGLSPELEGASGGSKYRSLPTANTDRTSISHESESQTLRGDDSLERSSNERVVEPSPTPRKIKENIHIVSPLAKLDIDLYRSDWNQYGKAKGISLEAFARQRRSNEPWRVENAPRTNRRNFERAVRQNRSKDTSTASIIQKTEPKASAARGRNIPDVSSPSSNPGESVTTDDRLTAFAAKRKKKL